MKEEADVVKKVLPVEVALCWNGGGLAEGPDMVGEIDTISDVAGGLVSVGRAGGR